MARGNDAARAVGDDEAMACPFGTPVAPKWRSYDKLASISLFQASS